MIQMYTEEAFIRLLKNPGGLIEKLELEFALDEDSRQHEYLAKEFCENHQSGTNLLSPSEEVIFRILNYSKSV